MQMDCKLLGDILLGSFIGIAIAMLLIAIVDKLKKMHQAKRRTTQLRLLKYQIEQINKEQHQLVVVRDRRTKENRNMLINKKR